MRPRRAQQEILPVDPDSILAHVGDEVGGAGRPRWWRDQRRRRLLALADLVPAIAIGAAVVAATGDRVAWGLAAVVPALLIAKLLGLYDADHRAIRHQTSDEIPALALWAGIVTALAIAFAPGETTGAALALIAAGGIALSVATRALARYVWRRTTSPERTLVVGSGPAADAIRRKVELFADMHLELAPDLPPTAIGPVNGSDPVAAMVSRVDRVVIAWSEADPALVERLLAVCRSAQTKLSVISPFRGRARPAPRLTLVAELPVLEYNTWDIPRSTRILKRGFDLVVGTLLLVPIAPLAILIAIAIKLDDRGPVLFKQTRAGRNGKPFTMVKFRTMVVDAEERLGEVVRLDELAEPVFKLRRDPRVTRVGRILRRFSLDEVPQIWNVLRGDMSLVGPRPEELRVVERYGPEHQFRLELTPGMTGPMQVFGRGELTFKERLAVELDYLENMSIGRDMRLLVQTASAVVRGKGAF